MGNVNEVSFTPESKSYKVCSVFGFEVYVIYGSRPQAMIEFRKDEDIYWYRCHPSNPVRYKGNPSPELDKDIKSWICSKFIDFRTAFVDMSIDEIPKGFRA